MPCAGLTPARRDQAASRSILAGKERSSGRSKSRQSSTKRGKPARSRRSTMPGWCVAAVPSEDANLPVPNPCFQHPLWDLRRSVIPSPSRCEPLPCCLLTPGLLSCVAALQAACPGKHALTPRVCRSPGDGCTLSGSTVSGLTKTTGSARRPPDIPAEHTRPSRLLPFQPVGSQSRAVISLWAPMLPTVLQLLLSHFSYGG